MMCYNESMKTKNLIRIDGLPSIRFAHVFGAETYQNIFNYPPLPTPILEVTYVTEGALSFRLGDGEEEAVVTAARHTVVCNLYNKPLRVQSFARHEHRTVCCFLPYHIVDALPDTEEEDSHTLCLPFLIESIPENSRIPHLIDEIILAHTMHTTGPLACGGMVLQLLDLLDKQTRVAQNAPAYHQQKYVKKAKEYIFDHLREPIHQTDIAAHLGISPEYLCNIFKQAEGVPIIQFINRIKLEQIRFLLENNDLTLAEATELYGYSDPNYVSRLHKKYFHFNITERRKR